MTRKGKLLVYLLVLFSISCLLVFLCVACAEQKSYQPDVNPDVDYMMIVNDSNPYVFDSDYDQRIHKMLKHTTSVYGEDIRAEIATMEAFKALKDRLKENRGVEIGILSGYLDEQEQQNMFEKRNQLPVWIDPRSIATPGYSEHHTGLLLTVMVRLQGKNDTEPTWHVETEEDVTNDPSFQYLRQNLADFGFIERYPKGKEIQTGRPAQPFEIRFVGSPFVAHKIMDKNMCLEEYKQQPKKQIA